MHLLRLLFLLIAVTASIFLVFGLYKPWVMLWWEDVQTRKKVINLYGGIAVIAYTIYWLLHFYK